MLYYIRRAFVCMKGAPSRRGQKNMTYIIYIIHYLYKLVYTSTETRVQRDYLQPSAKKFPPNYSPRLLHTHTHIHTRARARKHNIHIKVSHTCTTIHRSNRVRFRGRQSIIHYIIYYIVRVISTTLSGTEDIPQRSFYYYHYYYMCGKSCIVYIY